MSIYYKTLASQLFPSKPTFDVERDIPDLSGKVFAVSGGYAGVGEETCKALLAKNATVFILGRSQSKADKAMATLRENSSSSSGSVGFVECDLLDLRSVRKSAEELARRTSHIEGLFLNAGVMMCPTNLRSAQGYDMQFATNNLGHHALTLLLIDTLLASPFKAEGFPRVCATSSIGHVLFAPTGGVDFDTLKVDESGKRKVERRTEVLYGQSKLGNVLFANELQRRFGNKGLIATSCHPGALDSELYRHLGAFDKIKSIFLYPFLYPSSYGALSQLYAVTTPAGKKLGGKYLIPWAQVGEARAEAQDKDLAKQFWQFCEEAREGF